MPMPSRACYPARTDRRYRGSPSDCLSPSNCRHKSSRQTRWYRRHVTAQTSPEADLFSPASYLLDRRDLPARSRCSLWRLLPIQDGQAARNASPFSATAQRLYRLLSGKAGGSDGKSRPEFLRRYGLLPVHPRLSSATATSARSWQSNRLLQQSRWKAGGTLRSESPPGSRRSSHRGSARS
ncbi:hypothetical protein D3C75_653440 [compost metagenome]